MLTMARITGTNGVPLGIRRPTERLKLKKDIQTANLLPPENDGSRPRRCRWSPKSVTENGIHNPLGMPTALTSPMTPEQLEAYALQLRIKEITQKLYMNDVVPTHRERSPSPPPTYDNSGRRTNTREVRYRQKLEDERHALVVKAVKTIPEYKLPPDYRKPTKTEEKIYLPINEFPEVKFIGQLLGCRGEDLKAMETKSGAKIYIRGKGSVKEGKSRKDHDRNLGEEDLHCLIQADTEEKVAAAVALVQQVIETAASVPEEQNELKRKQLINVAKKNGTYRDDEGQRCLKCGEPGHRKYNCPQAAAFNANVVCYRCNQAGHLQKDCKSDLTQGRRPDEDQEYKDFMTEIGGGIREPKPTAVVNTVSNVPWRPTQYHAPPPCLSLTSSQQPKIPSFERSPGMAVAPGTSHPTMTSYPPPPAGLGTYEFGNLPPPPAASFSSPPPPPPTWNFPPPPPAWG